MGDIVALSRNAWNALRSEHQPAFDDLEASYRQGLLDRAQNVRLSGRTTEDGDIFQTFEQNVIEVLQPERFHPLSKRFNPIPEEVIVAEVKAKPEVNPMNTLSASAWNAIKLPTQPEFAELSSIYQGELVARAESIEAGGVPDEADSYVGRFEREVKRLCDDAACEPESEHDHDAVTEAVVAAQAPKKPRKVAAAKSKVNAKPATTNKPIKVIKAAVKAVVKAAKKR